MAVKVTGKGSASKAQRKASTRARAAKSAAKRQKDIISARKKRGSSVSSRDIERLAKAEGKAAAEAQKAEAIKTAEAAQKAQEEQDKRTQARLREEQVQAIQKDLQVSRRDAQYIASGVKNTQARAFMSGRQAQVRQARQFTSNLQSKIDRGQTLKAKDVIPRSGIALTPTNIQAIKTTIAADDEAQRLKKIKDADVIPIVRRDIKIPDSLETGERLTRIKTEAALKGELSEGRALTPLEEMGISAFRTAEDFGGAAFESFTLDTTSLERRRQESGGELSDPAKIGSALGFATGGVTFGAGLRVAKDTAVGVFKGAKAASELLSKKSISAGLQATKTKTADVAKTTLTKTKEFFKPTYILNPRTFVKGAGSFTKDIGKGLDVLASSAVPTPAQVAQSVKTIGKGALPTAKTFASTRQIVNVPKEVLAAQSGLTAKEIETIRKEIGKELAQTSDELIAQEGLNLPKKAVVATLDAISPTLLQNKNKFADDLSIRLQDKGFSGEKLRKALNLAVAQRASVGFTDPLASFTIAARSDLFARNFVVANMLKQNNLQKAFIKKGFLTKDQLGQKLNTLTSGGVMGAGALEGASLTLSSMTARGEPFSLKTFLYGTAIGGVGAKSLSTLAIRQTTSKVRQETGALALGNILDPFEKGGDILSTAFKRGTKADPFTAAFTTKQFGKQKLFNVKLMRESRLNRKADDIFRVRTPTPTLSPTLTSTISPTATPSPTFSPTATFTPSISPTISPTLTPTISPTITATPSLTITATPSVTPTITPTPTATPTITPTPTPTITPTATITATPTITPTPTKFFFPFMPDLKRKKGDKLHDVYAKVGGKDKKINKKPLGLTQALNLGAKFVDNNPSRRFRLATKKSKFKGKETALDERLAQKFKKKGEYYVEKPAFSIDSVAEVVGIPKKALARKKLARGGIFEF